MSRQKFENLVGKITSNIEAMPLDQDLERHLNYNFSPNSTEYEELAFLCAEGEREGWLMAREAGGIKYGRAIKPGAIAGNFSVDVVRMKDVKGPHHIHTSGEIGAILPLEREPLFDGKGPGWYVYEPGSAHHPTVEGGEAYILYLLPGGAIEFTGQ